MSLSSLNLDAESHKGMSEAKVPGSVAVVSTIQARGDDAKP